MSVRAWDIAPMALVPHTVRGTVCGTVRGTVCGTGPGAA